MPVFITWHTYLILSVSTLTALFYFYFVGLTNKRLFDGPWLVACWNILSDRSYRICMSE